MTAVGIRILLGVAKIRLPNEVLEAAGVAAQLLWHLIFQRSRAHSMVELRSVLRAVTVVENDPFIIGGEDDPGIALVLGEDGGVRGIVRILERDLPDALLTIAHVVDDELAARGHNPPH